MRFADLFSGLGGFHVALRRLGGECVFASELDDQLIELYEQNFGIRPQKDIRLCDPSQIPDHDILTAGFPCQPFSKAGFQRGFEDPQHGGLWWHVVDIIRAKRPPIVIVENVPNLARHAGGQTFQRITSSLVELGYTWSCRILDSADFGVPQSRTRLYLVATYLEDAKTLPWPTPSRKSTNIRDILDPNPTDARRLTQDKIDVLDIWQEFLDRFPTDEELPWYPIWAMEFGADYPFEDTTPYAVGPHQLRDYRGNFGRHLRRLPSFERLANVPKYAQTTALAFPDWKVKFIAYNRDLYRRHQRWIDKWKKHISKFPPSLQKLEWNCKGEIRYIRAHLVQFRASGVRVRRSKSTPALVSQTASQVPVITWENRYLTVREAARLQSLQELRALPSDEEAAFRALGNAVNAHMVYLVAAALLRHCRVPYESDTNEVPLATDVAA